MGTTQEELGGGQQEGGRNRDVVRGEIVRMKEVSEVNGSAERVAGI